MEAIILAGGFGTRLRPLTYTRAKPLLPVMNKPMISYIMEALPDAVDKVILAVNYRKDQIEEYLQEHSLGKEIIVNDEPKPLGTGGATKFAEEHITDTFLVLNSDIICSLQLQDLVDYHEKKEAAATISLWPVDNVSEFGVVDIESDGKITGFVEKPRPEEAPSELINAGAYCLDPLVLDYIETGKLVSMEKEIFPQIIDDTDAFYGYKFKGFWIDVGRISSYLKVHQLLLDKKKIDNVVGANSQVKGDIRRCSLGDNVSVDAAASIQSSVIYDNVDVAEDVTMKNCVIGENCTIAAGSSMENCVMGDNEQLTEKSNLQDEVIWNQSVPEGYPDKQIGNVLKE